MTIHLYSADIKDFVVRKEYPERYQTTELAEVAYQLNHKYVKGLYKEMYFDGIRISYANFTLKDTTNISFESDFDTVEMHFTLKGSSSTSSKEIILPVNFTGCQHNIIYASQAKGELKLWNKQMEVFEINLHPSFFIKYLPDNLSGAEQLKNKIIKGISSLISPNNRIIQPRMYQIIQDIISCNRKGMLKRIFLEARVLELLLLQIEQFQSVETKFTPIKTVEKDKIHAVREYILQNTNKPLSLPELAKYSGTNEYTLKKGFKDLFGTTVFGFWNDLKMKEAQNMLLNEEMNISEIADISGYKNPQHFSAAFKRRFGVAPRELRKAGH